MEIWTPKPCRFILDKMEIRQNGNLAAQNQRVWENGNPIRGIPFPRFLTEYWNWNETCFKSCFVVLELVEWKAECKCETPACFSCARELHFVKIESLLRNGNLKNFAVSFSIKWKFGKMEIWNSFSWLFGRKWNSISSGKYCTLTYHQLGLPSRLPVMNPHSDDQVASLGACDKSPLPLRNPLPNPSCFFSCFRQKKRT